MLVMVSVQIKKKSNCLIKTKNNTSRKPVISHQNGLELKLKTPKKHGAHLRMLLKRLQRNIREGWTALTALKQQLQNRLEGVDDALLPAAADVVLRAAVNCCVACRGIPEAAANRGGG